MIGSIRGRLTLWYGTVFLAVFLITGLVVLLTLNQVLTHDVSQRTAGAVGQASQAVAARGDVGSAPEGELPPLLLTDPELLQAGANADVFLRILDPAGQPLNAAPTPPPPPVLPAAAPLAPVGPVRLNLGGAPYLFLRRPIQEGEVVVGWLEGFGSLAGVDRTVHWLAWLLALAAVVGVGLAAAGGYLIARAAFRRVDAVIDTAHGIIQGDLERRLPLRPPRDELFRLARAFNEMIDSLQAAVQRQVTFVADASHELRTPVTVIASYVNMLKRWAQTEPAVREEALNAISRETERMSRLTGGLLRLASAGPMASGRLQPVNLSAVLQELGEDAQAVAEEKGLTALADIAPELWVPGNAERLREMFWAFLDNALKYTDPGGEIRLQACRRGTDVLIAVSDTGVGMTPEQSEHIFERFYRADPARSRQTESFGLGLAIAREVLRAHHGSVEVVSQPGLGTAFRLRLPAASPGNHHG